MELQRIEEIVRRCSKAAEGPWISFVEGRDHVCGSDFIRTAGGDIELIGATADDQDFIANARQDIPWLADEVYRLERILRDKGEYGRSVGLKALLRRIKDRPQMFVGNIDEHSLETLAHFIRGFLYSNINADRAEDCDLIFKHEFHDWVRDKLEKDRDVELASGRSYVFYLSEVFKEPKERLDAFFELCEEFFNEMSG